MKKSIADLSAEDLNQLAGEAWSAAAHEALSKGLPVTGTSEGRRLRYMPDGTVEDVGSVTSIDDPDSSKVAQRRSVA